MRSLQALPARRTTAKAEGLAGGLPPAPWGLISACPQLASKAILAPQGTSRGAHMVHIMAMVWHRGHARAHPSTCYPLPQAASTTVRAAMP